MKKSLILAAAAIAALSACTKEIELTPSNDTKAPVFTATIEPETKTVLATGSTASTKKVEWLSTDEVFIQSFTNKTTPAYIGRYAVTPGNEDATTATLTASSAYLNNAANAHKEVFAVYPASYAKLSDKQVYAIQNALGGLYESACLLNLPKQQTYNVSDGNDISKIAPMMAYRNQGGQLQFKNLTALLAITISKSAMKGNTFIDRIIVKSDKVMCGEFEVQYNQDNWPLRSTSASPDSTQYAVNLRVSPNYFFSSEDDSKTFYIAIPPQTYSYLRIEIGQYLIMTTKAGKSITVERNKIYPITFVENQPHVTTTGTAKANINGQQVDVPWVQLWAGGPKWALYNVGATVLDYTQLTKEKVQDGNSNDTLDPYIGGLYCWGGSTNCAAEYDGYKGTGNLPSEYDTATKLWGSNWRMPTKAEMEKLEIHIGKYWKGDSFYSKSGYMTGYSAFGEGGDYDGEVFFPMTGFAVCGGRDSRCSQLAYWTSTYGEGEEYSGGYLWCNPDLNDLSEGFYLYPYAFYYGEGAPLCYAVRAVLNE